jgi:hypothetical protein
MSSLQSTLVGAGALFASIVPTQAAMLPMFTYLTNNVRHVNCAVGAHIGPLGACILGTPDRPSDGAVIIEHPPVDAPREGCTTKSVTKTDETGNSVSRSRTDC